jgi:thiol-disulfide isomerase/thioredoxin
MQRYRANVLGMCAAVVTLALTSCEQPRRVYHSDPNPLLGKAAPAFTAVDPDGNEVDLKQYLGKNVIMLDFWATWCGPCLMAMPEVKEVADKYKDSGLKFFAVNVGEDSDSVKEFLAKYRLDIPVVMDFEGEIQNLYHGDGLPYSILIGKDGRVQMVHRGYRKGFGAELSEEVAALLEGKNLVAD